MEGTAEVNGVNLWYRITGEGEPVVQITVLNMTDTPLDGTIRSESLPHGATVVDATDHSELGTVDDLCSFPLRIDAYGSRFLVLRRNVEQGA